LSDKPKEIKVFLLTADALKVIRGTHGFGSWKIACTGCGKRFTEVDIGETIVSVPRKKRHAPKLYYHLKCFNNRNIEGNTLRQDIGSKSELC
jgi:hypothetical protein